jgi:LSD1 subclass zinc finger protein
MSSSHSGRENQYEEYVRDGILAAKNGQRKLAQSLLNRALLIHTGDARPYIWLAAATDDAREQIEFLEKAVAVEPGNAAARRGLALLTGQAAPESRTLEPAQPPAEVDAAGETFQCPKCGGRMRFDLQAARLTCEYCGHAQTAPEPGRRAEEAEQVMDHYMHSRRGHTWAAAVRRLRCSACGALNALPPGQKQIECAYCGSNQLVQPVAGEELIDPQWIGVMTVDAGQAQQIARRWLGGGLFSPDSLLQSLGSLRLRPAYYSCWTFDGMLEVRWTCEVAEGGNNKQRRWLPVSGVEARFFNDTLVSGVEAVPTRRLDRLEPFPLADLKAFQPDYLAGWPCLLYTSSLADASLVGIEKVLHKLRPELNYLIQPGREKRNLNIGGSSWSGMTFKHILLPLWNGVYQFQGREYHFLINGMTGKIAGDKPRDSFKLVLTSAIVITLVILIFLVFWILFGSGTP